MGCNSSKRTMTEQEHEGGGSHKGRENSLMGLILTRKSTTETKISQALLKKKLENDIADKPLTFERLLLKFEKIRHVIGYVKTVFNQVATDGKLDHQGLENTFLRLGVSMMTLDEILDLFDFIDVRAHHFISIKEFLVALTIGMVLDVIPAFNQTNSSNAPQIKRSFSGLLGHQGEIKDVLNLIVSAYLIFDPKAKGFIEKQNVISMLDEHGKHKRKATNALLSQQRWDEMDWDANGTIDFAEFVFTFTTWVETDEGDDDEEEEEHSTAMIQGHHAASHSHDNHF